jgi:hypothetical protein
MFGRLPMSLACGLLLLGCGYRERGKFAVVSTRLPAPATLGGTPLEGKACFRSGAAYGADHVISAATKDALSHAPGADGLANVTVTDVGSCIYVHGFAFRFEDAER